MEENLVVWVLTDHIVGNSNQALELARKLSNNVQIKNLKYNFAAKLPNFILKIFPWHIKSSIRKELAESFKQSPPNIIISAGRRTAMVALYLKNLSEQNPPHLIQVMRPDVSADEFDIIILPQHDQFSYLSPNVIRMIGSLNDVQSKIHENEVDFHEHYPSMKKFIAVLIGGSSKTYKMTIGDIKPLLEHVKSVAKTKSMKILLTVSRRTPQKVQNYIMENLGDPHIVYQPDSNRPSPYPSMINLARYIIVTADSVSMCSEATSSGNPVYLYLPQSFKLVKHRYFIQQLVDIGVARYIDLSKPNLEHYNYKPLNELDRIGKIIKTRL